VPSQSTFGVTHIIQRETVLVKPFACCHPASPRRCPVPGMTWVGSAGLHVVCTTNRPGKEVCHPGLERAKRGQLPLTSIHGKMSGSILQTPTQVATRPQQSPVKAAHTSPKNGRTRMDPVPLPAAARCTPAPGANAVHRPRTIEWLHASFSGRLSLVSAGAGWGAPAPHNRSQRDDTGKVVRPSVF
jgi:hypothetical protein